MCSPVVGPQDCGGGGLFPKRSNFRAITWLWQFGGALTPETSICISLAPVLWHNLPEMNLNEPPVVPHDKR